MIGAVNKVTNEEVTLGYTVAVVDAGKVKVYMKNFGEFYNNQVETASTIILSRTDSIPQKKLDTAVGMGVAVTFVMGLASAFCSGVNAILVKLDLEYMTTVAFILVIAALVQFIEMFLKKAIPSLYSALGVYLPLITTNCAVLGVAQLNVQNSYGFIESVTYGITGGLGFLLAMVLFSGLRSRIDETNIPKPFRGLAVTLIAASFISLAFMGFAGIVDALFA